MKKRFLRIEGLMLAVLLLLATLAAPMQAAAEQPLITPESGDAGIVEGGNDQLRLYVNGANGQFAVVPAGDAFTEDMLKSYAAVSIGGTEYTYGGNYPDAGTHFSGVTVQDGTLVTQWLIFDYAIQQHMAVVEDTSNHQSWAAHIWYDILYVGAGASDIALRLLLDTRFGADDSAAVVVGEAEISAGHHFAEAPTHFYVPETTSGPRAFGVLTAGADAVAPAALSFLNYGQAQAAGFQLYALQADAAQSLAPDSAALFDFPKTEFTGGTDAEADYRVTYALQYGFYGIGVDGDTVELTPEEVGLDEEALKDQILEELPILAAAAGYPIGERASNFKNLLAYSASAAPGETVEVQRVPQPEGILYKEENLAVADADRMLTLFFQDGTRCSGAKVNVKANEDGTLTYSFTMPDAADLDAHGGGLLLGFEAEPAPGYYALKVMDPELPGFAQSVQMYNDLPHSVAKPGATVTLAATSTSTSKIYLDIFILRWQAGLDANYERLDVTDLPNSDMELGGILDSFVNYYTMQLPSAAPDDGLAQIVEISPAQNPVLADFDFPEGTETSVLDHEMLRDGSAGMYWYYRYSVAGMENWDSQKLQDYKAQQNVTFKIGNIGVNDYNNYKVAVFDGEGNELPFFYTDYFSSEQMLFDPTGKMVPSTQQGTYTLTQTRPMLSSIYLDIMGSTPQAAVQFYLPDVSPTTGNKLTDVRLFVGTTLPNRNTITVVDSTGTALDKSYYAITATQASPGEQVQLSLFDPPQLFINEVRFDTAVTGPGGISPETEKNRTYDFMMPAQALTITVDLQAPAVPKPRYDIVQHRVVNQQGDVIYDGRVMDQSGAAIRTQLAGERVYLSAPISTNDPNHVQLQAEPYRVFDRADSQSEDLKVYPAANDPNAPTDAAWYFVMPETSVGVTFRTLLIEKRKNIILNETAESFTGADGAVYSYELDATNSFTAVNGYYMPLANPGTEVRVVLQKQVYARQMQNGQWRGSSRFLYGPNVSVQDATGQMLRVQLVPAANMHYDAETYYEYAFTMPESDATVDVNWKLGMGSDLTVNAPQLPAGVAAPKVNVMPVKYNSASRTSVYDVQIEYPVGDNDFSIDTGKLPVGVTSIVLRGNTVMENATRFLLYSLEISQDTTITMALEQLVPYPTITSATQNTPYYAMYPKLFLTGHGITNTTNEAAAFDYRFIYASSEIKADDTSTGSVGAAPRPVTEEKIEYAYSRPVVQADGSTLWTTAFFDTGIDRPYDETVTGKLDLSNKGPNLRHLTIEVSRMGMDHWVPIFDTAIEFATEITTAEGEYNFLSVVKEQNAQNYKAYGSTNQHDLDRLLKSLNAGTRLLDISSDAGFKYNTSKKTFTLLNSDRTAQVKIGSVLTAEVPKGALFSVYENNGSVRVRMSPSVKLATPKQDLLTPPKTFGEGKYYEIVLRKGTRYATRYEEIYNTGGTSNIKPIQVEWANELVPSFLQLSGAVSVKLSNIQIFDTNIVVGGSLRLALPKVTSKLDTDIINVKAEQVKYGYKNSRDFGLEGFKANGSVNLTSILGLIKVDGDVGAKADIDTLSSPQYYHFDLELVLMDIGFNGELTLMSGMVKKYPQWLLPDQFSANVHAPIPIVPGVLELSRVGGGFYGLYNTLNADYSDITQMIPAISLWVGGTLELLDVMYGDFAATLGPSSFWFDVKGGATFMDVKDLLTSQFGYKVKYEKNSKVENGKHKTTKAANNAGAYHFTLGGGAVIDLLPKTTFLSGITDFGIDLWLDLSYEHLLADDGKTDIKEVMKKNTAVEFHMYGKLLFQIPKFRFWGKSYGPYAILGIDGALTHESVRASTTILFIRIGFSYNWSTKKPGFIFELASAGDSAQGAQVPAYDDDGEMIGVVSFGDNLTLLASTQPPDTQEGTFKRQNTQPLALGGANIVVQGNTHRISVPQDPKYDSDYGIVVQVGLTPDKFTVLRREDSGQNERWLPYALNCIRLDEAIEMAEAESDAINALMGEDATLIQLAPGEWKITANTSFDSWVLEAEVPPDLTELTYNNGQMHLEAAHLDAGTPYYVSYGLTHTPAGASEQYIDLGALAVDAANIAADGTLSMDIPLNLTELSAELDSDEYTVYARLFTDIPGETEPQEADQPIYTGDKEQLDFIQDKANPVQIVNSQAPAQVTDVQVSAGPNASMKVSWPAVDGANQYEVALYEVNGEIMTPMVMTQSSEAGEVQTPLVYTVEAGDAITQASNGSGGTIEKTVTGLPEGGTFTVVVTAVKSVTEQYELPSLDENGNRTTSSLASVNNYRAASVAASGTATIAQPQAPNISIQRAVQSDNGLELTIGEDGGIIQAVSADDKACDMTLYAQVADETSISWESVATASAATSLSHTVGYADAAPMYLLEATNPSTGDKASTYFMVVRSSVAPPLTVNLTEGEVRSNGKAFSITGVTQPMVTVVASVSGANNDDGLLSTTADAAGNFTLKGTLGKNEKKRNYVLAATGTGGVAYQEVPVKYTEPTDDPGDDSSDSPSSGPATVVSPQTGDSSNPMLWLVVLGAAVAGLGALAAVFIIRRRRSGNR